MKDEFPPEMKKSLAALLSRVRRIQFWRGFWATFLALIGGLILVTGIDLIFAPLPSAVRWLLFVIWSIIVIFTVWKMLVKPLKHKISLVQIALWMENRHPEIEERVSSAMELSQNHRGVSIELLKDLTDHATSDMASVNPKVEVNSKKVRPWLWAAAVLGAIVLALLLIFPQEYGRLITRAFTPYKESGNAGAVKFTINPGNLEVVAGDEVVIKVTYEGEGTLNFVKTDEKGLSVAEPLIPQSDNKGVKSYRYQIPAAEKTFSYHATAGRAESDHFKVTVWPLPSLEKIRVSTVYPDYTELPPRETALKNGVEALAHSHVELSGIANTQTENGRLLIDGKELGEIKIDSMAAGGKVRAKWLMIPEGGGLAQIMLKHRLGHEVEAARFPVTVLPDEAPIVTLISPVERKLRLRPNETLSLVYQVSEEIGVAHADLEMKVNGRSVPDKRCDLPEKITGGGKIQLWEGLAKESIGAILEENPGTHRIEIRVKISDNRPADFDGPGVGFSEWITIEIDRNAESMARQEHMAQRSDMRETIQEAINDTNEAVQKMEQQREALKNEELSETAIKEIEKAREKLAGAEEKLAELEKRMEQGVQAHRKKEIAEARSKIAEAREALEQAPLQDSEETRKQELDKSRDTAREALAKLEEARNKMEQDNQRLEDLIRLEELAREQEELARRAQSEAQQNAEKKDNQPVNPAEQAQAENFPKPPSQEFKQDQEQVENRLREQLSKSPEAMAEALKRQAEQAADLQKKAAELSQEQAKLKEAAQKLAESQEKAAQIAQQAQQNNEPVPRPDAAQKKSQEELAAAIRENISRQQQEILDKAGEVLLDLQEQGNAAANEVPEAMAKGKESAEATSQKNDQAAAEKAKEAAESFQEAANKSDGKEGSDDDPPSPEQQAAAQNKMTKPDAENASDGKEGSDGDPPTPEQQAAAQNEKAKSDADNASDGKKGSDGDPPTPEEQAAAQNEKDKSDAENASDGKEGSDGVPPTPEKQAVAATQNEKGEPKNNVENPEADADAASAAESLAENDKSQKSDEQMAEPPSSEASQKPESANAQTPDEKTEQLGAAAHSQAAMKQLAEKQEQVAEALDALANGDTNKALENLQELQAQAAADFSKEVADTPQVQGETSEMAQAKSQTQQGAQKAQEAAQQQAQNQAKQSAQSNEQSEQSLAQAAEALGRAAESFEQQSQEMAKQKNPEGLPMSAENMAEAFQKAAQAADAQSQGQAAQAAQQASEALQKAAQQSRQAMAQGQKGGQPKPGQKGQPGQAQQASQPGEDSKDLDRPDEGDKGVPPELAKLGVSMDDWEKIKENLRSNTASGGGNAVPGDYRDLVKDYFQQLSESK